jgi:beta-lactamase regulating signal transducer with metallopeptidase domain
MNLEVCQNLFVSLAVRSTVLVVVIWLGLKLSARRSAPFRCALLTTGMVGLALLPLSWCLPRVEVPFLPAMTSPLAMAAGESVTVANQGWISSLMTIWFLGMGVLALGQSVGIWQLQRWRDRSETLDSGYWRGLVTEVSTTLDYRGQVSLFRCPMIQSPAAAGLFRPCVFLPEEASTWDAERLRIVLLHEIGHLKRRDLWTQWLSQSVCALYWFHPLVWMLNRSLDQTREFACDHAVLSSGTDPSHYAKHLLALAKNFSQCSATPRLAMANGLYLAMASPNTRQSALEQRVRAILSYRGSCKLSLLLGALWISCGLTATWATATLAPAHRELAWPSEGGIQVDPMMVHEPLETHLRVTADPFPGN